MNILFLTTHLNTGGITSYLLTLGKGLVSRGHTVYVCSSGGNMEKIFSEAGIKLVKVDLKTKSVLNPKLYFLLPKLKKIILKYHIQVIHAHTRVTQFVGQMLSSPELPLVTTCHGFFKPRFFRRLFPCWGQKVIAISPAVYDHLRRDFSVSQTNIALVPSGIDLSEFIVINDQDRVFQRKQLNVPEDVVVLGMIARLSDVKGQDILIEAMREVVVPGPKVHLLIAGEGKMEPKLRAMVKQYQLDDHISFYSVASRTLDLLAALDILVVPSRMEGLGLSILEAQAAAVPVVASRVGGIVSLIEDQKTGFLAEPGNSRDLAKVLINVISREDRGKSVGLSGRDFVIKAKFLEKMIEETERVYYEVIGKK
ncbi:MAG: glycosyltransferase family 4 protein [Candidatus Omnitrophica bacterium]|nr:glycosyltransferase family 4 protein [Candidatus Omnitrophota bacterium]